ncbi:MAG: hypothetical protein ACI8QS_002516, partial [Planctomycetota bacterium]
TTPPKTPPIPRETMTDSAPTLFSQSPPMRRLVLAEGPRAVEEYLLHRVDEHGSLARGTESLLGAPLRIIVPSGALREHISARLVQARGAVLGIQVQTLDALSNEILGRANVPVRRGEALLDVFVRREARKQPLLEDLLGQLEDGFAPLVAVVRDLLDAGLDANTREHFDEAIAALPTSSQRRGRLLSITAVFHRVCAMAKERDVLLSGELFRRATDILEDLGRPGEPLPSAGAIVLGFADVTGRAGELLDALARRCPINFLLERPLEVAPDPAPNEERKVDSGARFSNRLAERLQGLVEETVMASCAPRRGLSLGTAPGREAEVRAAATSIRALVDNGVAPERIALVARDLTPFRAAISIAFGRLGLPFHCGRAKGLADSTTGQLSSLVHLLERDGDASVDRWLDLELGTPDVTGPLGTPETRLALRVLGLARLDDVHSLDVSAMLGSRSSLTLPLRSGGGTQDESAESEDSDSEDDGEPEADNETPIRGRRSQVSAKRLQHAQERAQELAQALAMWPEETAAGGHRLFLRTLLAECLGWRPEQAATRRLEQALANLVQETHAEHLTREEFVRLLKGAVEQVARPTLGSQGAGVRVIDAMEARGRSFEHLFLIGLERGVFPRIGGEDPLMPDPLRLSLCAVLPELPVKSRRRDEERYLFACLCASAAEVHLSHAASDEEGRAVLPSPLFLQVQERFGLGSPTELHSLLPSTLSKAFPSGGTPPRSAAETATLLALFPEDFGRADRDRARAAAMAEANVPAGIRTPLADYRRAVLDEYEGRGQRHLRPGPFFGFLGAAGCGKSWPNPWVDPQPVTAYEGYARCAWQLFLERMLRLEPLPDPMAALATIDARQLGKTVHGALEEIASGKEPLSRGQEPEQLRDVLNRTGSTAQWPTKESDLAALLERAAKRELQESGVPLPGLVLGLARRALPYVQAARERLGELPHQTLLPDGSSDRRQVLGVESSGVVSLTPVGLAPLELTFRVDRIDRVNDGDKSWVELIDYKTGKSWHTGKKEETHNGHVQQHIRQGKHLQGIAYAAGVPDSHANGRYVFLRDNDKAVAHVIDLDNEADTFAVRRDSLVAATSDIASAWRAGVFMPRLLMLGNEKGNSACNYCSVSEACLLGDSGAPKRIANWKNTQPADEAEGLRNARAALNMGEINE